MTNRSVSNYSQNIENDFILKVVIFGDPTIGKSTLLEKYVEANYDAEPKNISTIGVDLKIKTVNVPISMCNVQANDLSKPPKYVNNEEVVSTKLQLWDTAGQERFRSITQSYYRNVNIFILCFNAGSVIDDTYIDNLEKWIDDVKYNLEYEDGYLYVIGTKADTINMDNCNNYFTNPCSSRKKITQQECSDNIDELNQDRSFLKMTGMINKKHKTKFLGICSALLNMFVLFLPFSLYVHREYVDNDDEIKLKFDVIKNIVDVSEFHYRMMGGTLLDSFSNSFSKSLSKSLSKSNDLTFHSSIEINNSNSLVRNDNINDETEIEDFKSDIIKKNYCNLDQMFELIVKDYLDNLDEKTFTKIRIKKPVNIGLSSGNTWFGNCC